MLVDLKPCLSHNFHPIERRKYPLITHTNQKVSAHTYDQKKQNTYYKVRHRLLELIFGAHLGVGAVETKVISVQKNKTCLLFSGGDLLLLSIVSKSA